MTDGMHDSQRNQGYFEHERLVAYQQALEVLRRLASRRAAFSGSSWLFQQAIRAAGSVVLNVAEGASLTTRGAKKRHYGIALGSCGELAAALDAADAMGIPGLGEIQADNRREARLLRGLTK